MLLNSLSASSAFVFELCEARWKAEYRDKTPQVSGSAGSLGNACHEALQMFVEKGFYKNNAFHELKLCYDTVYFKYFSDMSRHAEGLKMLQDWFMRTSWDGREVLLTEKKERFPIKVDGMEVPFSFIFDRMDRLSDGSIEVVDYKTWIQPRSPDDMGKIIQPRTYSLAARTLFPDAERIWVTYDQLRYDTVSRSFTKEDDIATYRYLQELVRRIAKSDGSHESLNPDCGYCVRRSECETLKSHVQGGGSLAFAAMPVDELVDIRAKYSWAQKALQRNLEEMDEIILQHMEDNELTEMETSTTAVKITSRSQRTIDQDRAAQLLGPELMAKYGSIGITKIDHILKNEPDLDAGRKSLLKQAIRKEHGKAYLSMKPLTPLADTE